MEGENIVYKSCFGTVYAGEMMRRVTIDFDVNDAENGNDDRIFVLGKDWMKVSVLTDGAVNAAVQRYSPIDIITVWGHVNHNRKCLDKFVASIGNSIVLGEKCNLVTLLDPVDINDDRAISILKRIFITEHNTIVTGE